MNPQFLTENAFTVLPMEENPAEDACARDWQELLRRYDHLGALLLREIFIELRFPVREGMSADAQFLEALKRGVKPSARDDEWTPESAEDIRVSLYPTPAGRVPVIEAKNDGDFIRLLQSIAYRCEPYPIPASRGAGIIKNYNNWARITLLRERFELENPGGSWLERFAEIRSRPELYRDNIILLSNRYYSGVSPELFGLEGAAWREKSLIIRREHEISHYMTQRFYHSAKNEIHDEIIADFMGLTAAFERYDPEMFLAFLGLEGYPKYRNGGRLEIYLNGIPAQGEIFEALCENVRRAAFNIEGCYRRAGNDRLKTFHILCRTSVADMADDRFAQEL